MPIFDFYCFNCKKEEERLVKLAQLHEQKCSCNCVMEKMDKISSNHITFKGKWFSNNKEY